jgi:hypothetical protein
MCGVGLVDNLTEWRARRWLTTLSTRLGTDGLAVAAVMPGLAAAVDQHAAAVRDGVLGGYVCSPRTERVLLADYGRGLLARTDVSMRQLRDEAAGRWKQADWLTLRLLAVCALGLSSPVRSSAGRAQLDRLTVRY